MSSADSYRTNPLNSRLTLYIADEWHASAQMAPESGAVLGDVGDEFDPAAVLSMFTPAEAAIELEVQVPPSAVLGDEPPAQSVLEYEPQEDASYVLLQAIETPEGVVYDFTLPEREEDHGAVLGPSPAGALRFPVNPLLADGSGGAEGAVLGVEDMLGGLIGGEIGGMVTKRVLQVLKTPFERSLIEAIRNAEGEAWVGVLRDPAGGFEKLTSVDDWHAILPPGTQHRVLLFIHGFSSSLGGAGTNGWFSQLGQTYDAILGYNHPTIWCDPEHNARELLKMIPSDVELVVDVIAHSRGGLVSRSLFELAEPQANFSVRRLITNGSPHGGTRLAEPERWDRLVSIGMTAASFLATAAGATVWIPKALELVLKAASQIVFDLPGVGAMTPSGEFIAKLNKPADSDSAIAAAQAQVVYSAISSRFSVFSEDKPALQRAFTIFAAQAFFDTPNDLVVPTESMTMLDDMGLVPKERQLLAKVDHFSYFNTPEVVAFMAARLAE